MKPIKTITKKPTGGKRSGSIFSKEHGRSGGSTNMDLGKTFNPPFLYATWDGSFARWITRLTYWR